MATRLWRWTSQATVCLLTIGLSVACGPTSLPGTPSDADPGSVAGVAQPAAIAAQSVVKVAPTAAKARPGALRSVPVKRDTVTETLLLDGMATAQAQEPIMYAWRAIVDDVKVKAGESVKQGDILVEFSQGDAPKTLMTARAALQLSLGNLAQAQAQAESSQAVTAQRVAADQKNQEQTVLDAQVALTRAQENLVKVQAGKSATERQVADTAVTYYGTTNLVTAQRVLDTALAGPDDNTIRLAQRDVANDQIALSRAQAELAALTNGPDPATLRTAQAAVQRAQSQLQLAQAAKIDPKAPDLAVAKIQHDNSIQDAQAALEDADAQVAKLKQPPADVDVRSARFHVLDAQTNLSTAEAKLETLEAGPDQAAIDDAQHVLEATKHALTEVQAIRDEVYSHPTPAELNQAQDQLRAAQKALDNARQLTPVSDAAGPDITAFQQLISQAEADVAAAEQGLEKTHLRAPFDGTVVSVKTKPGETPAPSRPVVIMARPGPPIVRVDPDDIQAEQLAVGQLATIRIGSGKAAVNADATVTSVTPATRDGSVGATASLATVWADGQLPTLGTPVEVSVSLGSRQDVLVVPKSAVHQSGARTTVEVQDGATRRLVSVQVGITMADRIEIVSGLAEGQLVLAGPV